MTAVELSTRDGVATIDFGDGASLTTLSPAVAEQMSRVLDAVEADDTLRCVVIAGRGRAFAVGADIKQLHGLPLSETRAYNRLLTENCHRVEALPVPVVACVNGHAFGGGLELALACTTRVAAASALLGLPEVKVGILPGSGGTVRLPRTVARGVALRMLVTGESVDAERALRVGLVEEVVPDERVHERAQELARAIAGNAPLSVRAILRAVREVEPLDDVRAAAAVVDDGLGALLETADAREGMAAFIERRSPRFVGA